MKLQCIDIKISLVLLTTLLLVGCTQDDSLDGHWHMIDLKERNISFEKDLYHGTFDYPETNEDGENYGIWDKGIGNSSGMLSHVYKNEIIVAPLCFGGNYTFNIENDSLKIFDSENEMIHIGYECSNHCCNKLKEFFLHVNLEIDLAIDKDTSKSIRWTEVPNLLANLFIGKSNYPGDISLNSDRLASGSKYLAVSDIPLSIEKHKVKIPENKRDRFSIAIYPNASSNLKLFSKVVQKCNELGFPKVYIAMREETDLYKEMKVRYREIDSAIEINSDSEMTIVEWLEKE